MDRETRVKTRTAILRMLKTYPVLSRSMLGLHLRPNYNHWSELLKELVNEGVVVEEPIISDTNGHNSRASITYRLNNPELTPSEMAEFIEVGQSANTVQ